MSNIKLAASKWNSLRT